MSWRRTAIVIAFCALANQSAAQVGPPPLARLVRVPTASMVEQGSADLRYDVVRDLGVFPAADRQRNLSLSLGLFPRITVIARGSVAKDSITGRDISRDLSASAQLLLVTPRRWRPAIALGLQDVGGAAANFRTTYLVASKEFMNRARFTLGYGSGPDVLNGMFGGGEFAITRAITLLGEFDASHMNAGLRVQPLPQEWAARGIPRPSIDVLWQHGRGLMFAAGVRTYLGALDRPSHVAPVSTYARRSDAPLNAQSMQAACDAVQSELIARGLENVRVTVAYVDGAQTMTVEYENRTYNRNELDALGLVLGIAALRSPQSVTHLLAIVRERNVAVIEVSVAASALIAYVNGTETTDAFAAGLGIRAPHAHPVTPVQGRTHMGARSWLKLDVFARPRAETAVLTEWGVVDARFSWLPEAQMQLLPGMAVSVRGVVPVVRTRNYPGRLDDPAIDRVLLQQALRIPVGMARGTAMTQTSVGQFATDVYGVQQELATSLADGVFLVKGTVMRVGKSFQAADRTVAFGTVRARHSAWDATLSLSAGRFLDGDVGYVTDVSRFFGNTEVGLFVRHSDRGSLAGGRFSIPLTVRKELAPRRVRPRLPDVYSYEHRTTILRDRNEVRSDIARSPAADYEIERVYWDRDRLYGARIRQHVEVLREAILAWIRAD